MVIIEESGTPGHEADGHQHKDAGFVNPNSGRVKYVPHHHLKSYYYSHNEYEETHNLTVPFADKIDEA